MVTAIDLSNQKLKQMNQKTSQSNLKKVKVQRLSSFDSDDEDPFNLMPKPQKRSGSLKPWQRAPAKEIFKLMSSAPEQELQMVLLEQQPSEDKEKQKREVEDDLHRRKSLITFHKTKQSDKRSASASMRAVHELDAVEKFRLSCAQI